MIIYIGPIDAQFFVYFVCDAVGSTRTRVRVGSVVGVSVSVTVLFGEVSWGEEREKAAKGRRACSDYGDGWFGD